MVNMMLVEALRTGASDIHLEPMDKRLRLRYRIDGVLVERPSPPKNLQAAVISRVKIMSELNIAERRVPQDGRFNIKALGREVDLRVSILPAVHGEKVVMRILDKGALSPSLTALGLDKRSSEAMEYAISQPHGILLVTGPTGSGKTTTLYSCLQDLNRPDLNIVTCEDPVEYQLDGINQVQINAEVGLSFASALRSILRQDPDVVLVGEIRDGETAEIAIKAALTGHLVLSTLHTNDAPGAATRLVDMGIEPFMLGSCLVLAQAQRLFRKLCPSCKTTEEIEAEVLRVNRLDPAMFEGKEIFKAVGCPRCSNGYKGRGAIMEVMLVNDEIRDGILIGSNTSELREIAKKSGMKALKEVGLDQVIEGTTSIEGALEVTGGE
jgi:type IV pilus assembly protein PilB